MNDDEKPASMTEQKQTAAEIKDRHGVDYDIPATVVLNEVTRDTDLSTAIREYPDDDEADYDVAQQVKWDLKGTWTWRAVALHDTDGNAVEWYGHSGGVLEYWPDYFDEPVWNRCSIYAFTDTRDYTLALHPWPLDMDPDVEVVG